VKSIRRSHIQAFKVDAEQAGVPQTSIKRALQLIRRVLDYAADDGLIDSNPAAGVKPPKPNQRPDVYVVTPEQVEKIRAKMPTERDKVIVSVLAYAGLRPAELRGLDAKHVGASTLRVEAAGSHDGKLQPAKSKASKRNVPICAALAADLKEYGVKSGPLFPNSNGSRMTKTDWDNWRKRRFEDATTEAKVPMNRPYELRHSIASMWLREGIDRMVVAQRLGHTVEMLERNYAHVMAELDPNDKRTVDEQITDARNPKKKRRAKKPAAS
jgi:integrase